MQRRNYCGVVGLNSLFRVGAEHFQHRNLGPSWAVKAMSWLRLGAACSVAGLLAACGGGNSSNGASGTSSTTSSAQTAAFVVSIGGSGTVTSSPTGLDCVGPNSCSQTFPLGTTVTLIAAPASGQTFVGWGGACSGTVPQCMIVGNATENVSANFARAVQMEPLQVTVGGAGSVTSNPTGINCTSPGTCSQSYASGAAITLSAAPASGNLFVGWTGACSGSASTCTVTMNAPQSVGATFAAAVQNDSLQVTVGGSGTITSSPAGINCSGSTGCNQTFANGTLVTLTAAPAAGNAFSGWSGACSGSATTCTVTMSTSTMNVGATFASVVVYETLQVTMSGTGSVSSTPSGISCTGGSTGCSQTFVAGTRVTLNAAPGAGFAFSGWSGACSGTTSSCTVTMSSPSQNVGASFTAQTAPIVLTIGGSGTVTSSPTGLNCVGPNSCRQPFPLGTTVTLSAAPASGQTFVGWGGVCSGSTPTCVIVANATENVSANFAPAVQMEPLQVTVGGAGSVTSNPAGINCTSPGTCSQSYASGTAVTLSATAASGNIFVGWTGACSGSASTCTVTMNAPQSVGATFAAAVQNDSLQVTVGGSGTITSSPAGINCSGSTGCNQTFANGTLVTLTAAPAAGNAFSGWSGACSGSATTCTVTMSTSTMNVGATFASVVVYDTLQVTMSGTGSVSSTPAGISCTGGSTGCSQTFVAGTRVTLNAAPGAGFAFSGWSGACSGTTASCTVTMSSPSQNVGASFTAQTAPIVLTIGGSGTVTSSPTGLNCVGPNSCRQPFPLGTTVTLSAAPASGQTFVGWGGVCSGSTPTCVIVGNATENVSANFAPAVQMEPLQVTVGGAGSVTSNPTGINCTSPGTCSQSYASGTAVTLSATAASGNIFVGWSGACSGSATTCTVTMSAPTVKVGASFAPVVVYDTLQVALSGTGSVSST